MSLWFDPFALGPDRYSEYAAFRAAAPAAKGAPPFPGAEDALYLFSHAAIREGVRHPLLLQAPGGGYEAVRAKLAAEPAFRLAARSMLLSDAPRHGKLRRPLARNFAPSSSEALRPMLSGLAHECARKFLAADGPPDLIRDFATPFAVGALAGTIGIHLDDPETLRRATSDFASAIDLRRADHGTSADGVARLVEIVERSLRAASREGPAREGTVAALAVRLVAEGAWSADDALANLIFLLFAGQETMVSAIGNAEVVADELGFDIGVALRRGVPSLAIADELLRIAPPLHFSSPRIAAEDLVLADIEVAAGTPVVAVFASGNRDPAFFVDPEHIRFDRPNAADLSFGDGMHVCLGRHLARVELAVAIEALHAEGREWRIDRATLKWRDSLMFSGPAELAVRISKAGDWQAVV